MDENLETLAETQMKLNVMYYCINCPARLRKLLGVALFIAISAFTFGPATPTLANTTQLEEFSPTRVFYIDYEHGSDDNDGLSKQTAWKHSPGDAHAVGGPKALQLKPGDLVQFRGGVHYFGRINIPASGSDKAPIVFSGFGWDGGNAVLDGSTKISVVGTGCRSSSECNEHSEWEKLRKINLTNSIDLFTPIHINQRRYWLAQFPEQENPFWMDNVDNYYLLQGDSNLELLSDRELKLLPRFFESPLSSWGDAFIAIWVKSNRIRLSPITDIDPSQQLVRFEPVSPSPYQSPRQRFSFFNRPVDLVKEGQYAVLDDGEGLLYWPYSNDEHHASDTIQVVKSTNKPLIGLKGRSNIVIHGFSIQNLFTNFSTKGGSAVSVSGSSSKILIQDIEIRNSDAMQRSYAIKISGSSNVIIDRVMFRDNRRSGAVSVKNSVNVTVRGSEIHRSGATAIAILDSKDVLIFRNKIDTVRGVHSNGIAAYLMNENIAVVENTLLNINLAVTFHGNGDPNHKTNLLLLGNIIQGKVRGWSKGMNGVEVYNNIISSNSKGPALLVGAADNVKIKNNIISSFNLAGMSENWQLASNMYLDLTKSQRKKKWRSAEDGAVLNYFGRLTTGDTIVFTNPRELPQSTSIADSIGKFSHLNFGASEWTSERKIGPSDSILTYRVLQKN